jgi:DNA-binding CsgD family transcriptional regulator
MLVLGTQVHIVTFIFIVLEFAMFCIQLGYYLHYPENKSRLWYIILLFLLLFYNITGGFFPDPKIGMPIAIQNMIAYGSGFLMASYFPFYFYKAFDLKSLRWHALFGVPLFLMLPYLIFFVIMYAINGDLEKDIKYGVIAPFFYSLVLLWVMLSAIRKHYKLNRDHSYYMEEMAVYLAVSPWAAMTVFSWFQVTQLTEVLCTNTGFLMITVIFISKSVRRARRESELYAELEVIPIDPLIIVENCKRYTLTVRETHVVSLVCQRLRYRDIADKLFISERTVNKHVQNIFTKVGAATKSELIRKINGLK